MKNTDLIHVDLIKFGYLKIARNILGFLYSEDSQQRRKANVMVFLYSSAYWAKGEVHLGGQKWLCNRGEWIGRYADIVSKTEIKLITVRRILTELQLMGYIAIQNLGNGIRCRLMHYDALSGQAPKRSEVHTSELPSRDSISSAVSCLKKKKKKTNQHIVFSFSKI